jgi:hypothetical protein
MKKIKILRNFFIENTGYLKDQELIVEDDFTGSPSYYQVISTIESKKPEMTAKKRQKGRKRIPNRAVKSRNTAITNKDKS